MTTSLADTTDLFPIILVGGSMVSVIIVVIVNTIANVLRKGAEESTRRELAAYVAEGSMTTEEAERILEAGRDRKRCNL